MTIAALVLGVVALFSQVFSAYPNQLVVLGSVTIVFLAAARIAQ